MPLLTLDIGNTRVSWAQFADERAARPSCVDRAPLPTALGQLAAVLADGRAWTVGVSSVNPPVLEAVLTAVRTAAPATAVRVLNRDVAVPMATRLAEPTRTGTDRLAAALGALRLMAPPVIVVDAGTAVTVDAVGPEGAFLGGAILPGLAMQLAALHAGTAQIPPIALDEPPRASLGTDTTSAIRAGVWFGLAGAIERLVAEARRELGPSTPALGTGGDMSILASGCPSVALTAEPLVHLGIAEWLARAEGR